MPENRSDLEDFEFGYKEPEKIPDGRISIKKALDLVNKHASDREQFTAEVLASEYKLNVIDCQNVVKHFNPLLLHVPKAADGTPLYLAKENLGLKSFSNSVRETITALPKGKES
jgi:NADH dehydrogenase [ubiquinone] 1 alpha subcomplex assembly factor 4